MRKKRHITQINQSRQTQTQTQKQKQARRTDVIVHEQHRRLVDVEEGAL
jgi:hypothetical protein